MNDLISRQAAIEALKEERCPCESDYDEGYLSMLDKAIWIMQEWLPSAQPERTCVNCGRTVNNGGWYADGGTRCPMWEKKGERNEN